MHVPQLVHVVPRQFEVFVWGFGVYLFGKVAEFAGKATTAACSDAVMVAVFGGPAPAAGGVATCVVAASVAALAGSISAGLASFGAKKGWQWYKGGTEVGQRSLHASIIWNDTSAGMHHPFDAERYNYFSSHYGPMLEKHNTTLISISWTEASGARNHTGTIWEGFNMTEHGRLISFHDQNEGILRTAFGHVDDIHPIFQAFDQYKTNGTTLSSPLAARDIDEYRWVSFNSYGLDTNLAPEGLGEIQEDDLDIDSEAYQGDSTEYSVVGDLIGSYDKYCLAAGKSPTAGQQSIIVGETYWNQFGGIDNECDSG